MPDYTIEQVVAMRSERQMTQQDFYGLVLLDVRAGGNFETGKRKLSEPEAELIRLIHELGVDVRLIGLHNAAAIRAIIERTTAFLD